MKFNFSNFLIQIVLFSFIPATHLIAAPNKFIYCEGSSVPVKWSGFPLTFHVDMDDFNNSAYQKLNIIRSRINITPGSFANIQLIQSSNLPGANCASSDGINSIIVDQLDPSISSYVELNLVCDGPNPNRIANADIIFNSLHFSTDFDERRITHEMLYSLGLNKNNSNLNTHMNTVVSSSEYVFVGPEQIWPTSIDAEHLQTLYEHHGIYMIDLQAGRRPDSEAIGWSTGYNTYVSAGFRIQNTGYVSADLDARFYLSQDMHITGSDYYLGQHGWTVNQAPASVTSSALFAFPSTDLPEGEYYVGMWTDELGYYTETNEINNKTILGRISVEHN